MADLLIHPVTGEEGVWRYMAGLGWVNVDPNKIKQNTSGSSFRDIYDPPPEPEPANNYMTDDELALYNLENGTSFNGLHLRYHPDTGEEGIWTWDPMAGWRDDSKWLGPRTEYADGTPITGVGAFADVYKDKAEAAGVDTTPRQVIGWYWSGSEWMPLYQGDALPDGLPQGWLAPVSTKPNSPPQNAGTNSTSNNADPVITGWYYALQGGVEQWIPVYEGYNPLAGAPYVAGSQMPTEVPAGYGNSSSTTSTNTTSNNTTSNTTSSNTASNTPTTPTPEPPELFTPDKSMFYQGLYTASDLLRRDGGEINSPFYNNARQQVLDSLAAQATAAGRTQNTAEEIAMARGSTPTLTASGLFDPNFYNLVDELGI